MIYLTVTIVAGLIAIQLLIWSLEGARSKISGTRRVMTLKTNFNSIHFLSKQEQLASNELQAYPTAYSKTRGGRLNQEDTYFGVVLRVMVVVNET
jgi:hypothetical protein